MAVNAPDAGTIKEFLANEEDTVTVGQDLLKMEVGGDPGMGGKQKGGQEPKAPASDDQPTSSDPKPSETEAGSPQEPPSTTSPSPNNKDTEPRQQEREPSPPKQQPYPQSSSPRPADGKAPDTKGSDGEVAYGSREERRVGFP